MGTLSTVTDPGCCCTTASAFPTPWLWLAPSFGFRLRPHIHPTHLAKAPGNPQHILPHRIPPLCPGCHPHMRPQLNAQHPHTKTAMASTANTLPKLPNMPVPEALVLCWALRT
ncbi:hypothetical protein BCR44DRAFT_43088 [Catenaria anguillulae PL171]|uniref:Uncharacterized protein n=1 Tax=Catenaria anguillulae PL171 TaxID=765915 RepID=A0A1Y2I2Y5_9FUNG|nr:hypothetical protein BCR44DRAFT_43088 [Catenaria anguillulae PL171]